MIPRLLLALVAIAPAASLARADDPLPSGLDVLKQYVEATGGKAAYEKVKNRVIRGTLDVAGAGIKGTITITQAAPNKLLVETEIPGVEKGVQGTDGVSVWSTSKLTGDRLLEGEEKEALLLQSVLDAEVRPEANYTKVECTGVEDVEGKPAYKLVLTPKVGKPSTQYYDKASHLQVKSVATSKSPMGEITVETIMSDPKKVDGITMSFRLTQKVLSQEIVIALTEVKQNVDLPADTFKAPGSIQAMIDKLKK